MDIENVTSTKVLSGASHDLSHVSKTGESFTTILKAFEEEAAKMPAERARDEVLKRHNMTEAQYQKLSPEQREQIDREIAQAVRRACTKASLRASASSVFD